MPDIPLFTAAPRPGTYNHAMWPNYAYGGLHSSILTAEANLANFTRSPWDFEVRRATWQEREQEKFNQGIYTAVPFVNEAWFDYPDHFCHISVDDPSKIAFTESAAKGERDIQQRMSPGRYLTRFYTGTSDDKRPEPRQILTAKEIAFYAEWFLRGQKPVVQHGGEVQFAYTPEAIVDVYKRGPNSCMRNSDSVRVYGAGDLAIAYVEEDNKVISRALCWPDKKFFGRVYPTPQHYYASDGYNNEAESQAVQDDLRFRLRQMGFKGLPEGATMEGARLLRIEENGYCVGPYIDEEDVYPAYHPTDRKFLILSTEQEWDVGNGRETSGYFHGDAECDDEDEDEDEDYDTWRCDECDESYPEYQTAYTVYRSWTPLFGTGGERSHCRYCADNRSFVCEATGERFYDQSAEAVSVFIEKVQVQYSSAAGTHVNRAVLVEQTWIEEYAFVHAFFCPVSNAYFHLDCAVELHDGTLVGPDTAWFTDPKDGLNYLEIQE